MDPNEFHKPQFTTKQLVKMIGVEIETLRRWMKLGYVELTMENPGKGRQRLYSMADMVKIATIHLLSGVGFMPSLYTSILAKIVDSLALIKIMEDDAHSKGLKIYQWTTEELKETKEFKELFKDYPEMANDFEVTGWTAEDRYIMLFENKEGQIESKVSSTPDINRGVWLVVDVHGIIDEMVKKIPLLPGWQKKS